jgi:peptide/nickel transport system substrate-binding protein
MRRLKAIGALVAVGLLAAACSAGKGGGNNNGNSNGSTKATNTVTISNENGALWTCNFSPFNGSDTLLSVGFVYEPLVYVNALQNGKTTPMLATSWKWGRGTAR